MFRVYRAWFKHEFHHSQVYLPAAWQPAAGRPRAHPKPVSATKVRQVPRTRGWTKKSSWPCRLVKFRKLEVKGNRLTKTRSSVLSLCIWLCIDFKCCICIWVFSLAAAGQFMFGGCLGLFAERSNMRLSRAQKQIEDGLCMLTVTEFSYETK